MADYIGSSIPKLKQIECTSTPGAKRLTRGARVSFDRLASKKGIMMATIDKRVYPSGSVKYRVRTRLKGFPVVSASFARLTDAKRWAATTESAQREGRHFTPSEAKRHTLTELLVRYEAQVLPLKPKNARNQRQQLRWWREQLGHCLLSSATPAKIAECRDRLLGEPSPTGSVRAPATAVRYLAVLSHAFSVAMKEWGWVDDNPCRKVTRPSEPRGRVRFLDNDERARLLEACRGSTSPLLYTIVVLAIATGMRKAEMLNLRWRQINLSQGLVTLEDTKNGERRAVPLTGHALEQLRTLRSVKRADADLVFPGANTEKPIDVRTAWTAAVTRSDLHDFRFHDLRHTTASYLAQGGATPIDIAAVLGHKTLAMVKRYAHLSESRVRDVLADMNQRTFGPQAAAIHRHSTQPWSTHGERAPLNFRPDQQSDVVVE